VNHQGQFPVVTLSFNLAPGGSLGEAVNAVYKAKDQLGMPASIQVSFRERPRPSSARSPASRC
jgi:multidrug efflux pump